MGGWLSSHLLAQAGLGSRSGSGITLAPGTVACVLLASAILLASSADARSRFDRGKLQVTADELVYDARSEAYVGRGHVDIVLGKRSIQADWIAFSTRTERGAASGNVRLADDDDILQARFIEFNLETLEGVVFGADLDMGEDDFLVRAEILRKIGDGSYSFEQAKFTSCRCPEGERLPWELNVGEGDLTLGGYATGKNTTMEILGVPAIWLPWAMFPVKTDRESGVLFPVVEYGKTNGFEFGVPLFWAARDELNVTFTPNYLEKRGFKPDLELEYVLGERSYGQLYGSFIHDEKVADRQRRNFSPNRWAVAWEQDQWLPLGWRFRSDVKLVSDNEYAYDFGDFSRYRNYRYLNSSAYVVNHFLEDGRLGLTGSVLWADDLQTPDTTDRDPFLVHRLPELEADLLAGEVPFIPGLVASFDTDYIYFFSQEDPESYLDVPPTEVLRGFLDTGVDSIPDLREPGYANPGRLDPNRDNFATTRGPELDGRLQDGEPLTDRGSRIVLYPSLAYPVRLFDSVEFYPEVAYYQTLYFTEEQSFAQRGLVTARADLRSRFTGIIDLPFAKPVRHVLEPRLSWAFVQKRNQRGNPVFIPPSSVQQSFLRQLDLDSIVLDPADRIRAANLLTLGFENRFYAPGSKGLSEWVGDVVLEAGYDFADRSLALINIQGRTRPREGIMTRFLLSIDPGRGRIEQGEIDASGRLPSWRWFGGGAAGLAYRWRRQVPLFFSGRTRGRYDDQEPINQIDAFVNVKLWDRWKIAYAMSFSLEGDELLRNVGSVKYASRCECWEVGVAVSEDRKRSVQFRVLFTLLGVGDGVKASGLTMGAGGGMQDQRF